MLQNDMGNTRIQDSATGNIMGLSPGFIPVGMKEHGGIMYIASVNKEGEGEIGTIPSPIIRDFYKDKQQIFIDKKLSNASYVSISNKIYPADKIIINLGLTVRTDEIVGNLYNEVTHKSPVISPGSTFVEIDPCDYYTERFCIIPPYKCSDLLYSNPIKDARITAPIISYSPNTEKRNLTFNKGIFKLKLASKSVTNVETEAPSFLYEAQGDSNYWFYHTDNISHIFPSDLFEATLNKSLKSFPTDSKPGYLQVKLQNEEIKTFGMLQREKHPIDTPITIKIKDSEYETYFPGFYYNTESGIYVSKIQCKVFNQQTRDYCKIHLADGTSVEEADIYFDVLSISDVEIKSVVGFVEQTISKDNYSLLTPIVKHAHDNHHLIYPQLYNSETGDFYLTNLTDIEKIHTQYKSSTLNNDGSNIIPYSGLFKIKLDETTYSHWHKLTVLYYNQYNEKIGEYTCVFNPQLNDVFGSNVNIGNIEIKDFITMGSSYQQNSTTYSSIQSPSITYLSQKPYTDKQYAGDNPMANDIDRDDGKSSGNRRNGFDSTCIRSIKTYDAENIKTYASPTSLSSNYNFDFKLPENTYPSDLLLPPMYNYLYKRVDRDVEGTIEMDNIAYSIQSTKELNTEESSSRFWYSMHNGDPTINVDWTNAWDLGASGTHGLSGMYIIRDNYISRFDRHSITLRSKDSDYVPNFYGYHMAESKSSPSLKYSIKNFKLSDFNDLNIYQDTVTPPSISFMFGPMTGGSNNSTAFMDRDFAGCLYTISKSEENSEDGYIEITLSATANCTTTIKSTTYNPVYKVAPYFLLQDPKREYINKFHLTDQLFYNCNFVLDGTGIPINYLNTQSDYEPEDDSSAFSYYQPQHKTLFDSQTLSATNLAPGIYVFNMTAPSIENMLENADTLFSITVQIGDKSTTTLYPYTLASSTQINYNRYSGYGTTVQHLWPIVILVEKTADVYISINISDGQELRYQQAGMYKLKQISDTINSDLAKSFKDMPCYLFPDYQQKILNIADNLPEEDQHVFKQTYGIFFRQAYSYVEGLYDSSTDTISSITLGTVSYPKMAFVPAEPYILNYMWDITPQNENNCSAACLYCQPKDVLYDRQNSVFKLFPSINTSDCITTQLYNRALTSEAISCQPSDLTVLIKSNDVNEN